MVINVKEPKAEKAEEEDFTETTIDDLCDPESLNF